MKYFRFLLVAALVALPLTACDEDDDTGGTVVEPTPVGTVAGNVTVEGTGLAGVDVTLVGATSQSATTGSGGSFSFANVEAGSYGVTISGIPSDVSFSTTSKTTSITTDGQTVTVDFSGSYIRTSTIAGQVMVGDAGLAGIAVTATGPEGAKNAVTDNGGNYSFTGLRAGDYTVAISGVSADYSFTTTSYSITLGTGEAKTASFFGTEVQTVDPVTASVVIKSVTTGATNVPVVPTNVAGQIDVTLQIDPGENELSKIALLLNGTEVASQNLSQAVAGEEMEKAGGIFEVVFSINTAEFACDETAGTCTTTYGNGQYELAAQLGLENAQQASVNTSVDLTFNNADTFAAKAYPTNSIIGGSTASNPGALYYGNGPILVKVWPVLYSGKTVASVTTGFTATGGGTAAVTVTGAPFDFNWKLTGYNSAFAAGVGNEAFTVTNATYTDGTSVTFAPALPVMDGSSFFVDNVAPAAGSLELTEQVSADELCCSNNWVNSAYAISDGYSKAPDNAGAFVGGVTTQYFAGMATATNTSIAGGTAISTIGDAGLAATLVSTTYTLVHQETDALGNVNTATRMVASTNGDNPLTTFGIDDTPPATQVYSGTRADYTILNAVTAGAGENYNFTKSEDKSGFSTDFIRAHESLFNTTGTTYPNYGVNNPTKSDHGDMLNYPGPMAAPDNTFTEGYYTFDGYVINQAGGAFSPMETIHTLVDVTAPVAQNVQIPGSLVGGAPTLFTAPVSDNLDLVSADFDFQFGATTTGFWPFGDPNSSERILGTAWDDVLTTSATAQRTVNFVSSVETTTAAGVPTGTIIPAAFVRVGAMDAAGNKSVVQVNNFAIGTVTPTTVSYAGAPAMTDFTIATTPAVAGATNLCNGQGATACPPASAGTHTQSITVTLKTTGAAGTYAPPFAGGYIYLYALDDGVDATPNTVDDAIHLLAWASGSGGSVDDDGTTRTYTYTFTVTSADVAGIINNTGINFVAIGVNGSGAGLVGPLSAAYTVVDGS